MYNIYQKYILGDVMNEETTLENLQNYISNRIYQLRISKHMSARKLSLSLGMSSGYINKIENFKTIPSIPTLFEICLFFNMSLQEFFADFN